MLSLNATVVPAKAVTRFSREGTEAACAVAMTKNLEPSDNERLVTRVRKSAVARIPLAAQNVRVDAAEGMVILSGRVRSYYHKQLWLNATKRVAGVERVIDKIEVAVNGQK
jgi:osmotically-inducible protein OsmY